MSRNEFIPLKFLTEKENNVLYHLERAQQLFDQLAVDEPQVSTDSFNFGHYIDAARTSVIIRGARRLDESYLHRLQEQIPRYVKDKNTDASEEE